MLWSGFGPSPWAKYRTYSGGNMAGAPDFQFSGTASVYSEMEVDGCDGNGLGNNLGGAGNNNTFICGQAPVSSTNVSRQIVGNGDPIHGGFVSSSGGYNSMGFWVDPLIPLVNFSGDFSPNSGGSYEVGLGVFPTFPNLGGTSAYQGGHDHGAGHVGNPLHGWGSSGRLLGGAATPRSMSMNDFRIYFGTRRDQLGFRQRQVAAQITREFGMGDPSRAISDKVVSNFEMMNMSAANMAFYRPIFERWLELAERDYFKVNQPGPLLLKKKATKTAFTLRQTAILETRFSSTNGYPSHEDIEMMRIQLNLTFRVITNWFCHRRRTGFPPSNIEDLEEE